MATIAYCFIAAKKMFHSSHENAHPGMFRPFRSESKGLQAAAGSGFIGFSAFQTSATMPSTWGAQPGVTTSASGSPDDLVKSPTGSSKSGIGRGRALKIVGGRGAGGASGQVGFLS